MAVLKTRRFAQPPGGGARVPLAEGWVAHGRMRAAGLGFGDEYTGAHSRGPCALPHASPGRHCHSTLSVTVIACHYIGV